ncbi:MAG: zf-HC2 domain-containing protein [Chromatiaceae bacterium]
MLNCKEATQLMSQELDRTLTWRERTALRLHVLMCSGCSNFRRQMAFLRTALRSRTGGEE